jgi:hypothetical protein
VGVDILEFVLEVEDTFGLVLAEDELAECDTIGAMSALIWRRLAGGSGEETVSLWACPNRVAFGRLRGAIADQAGVPRRSIRADSSLDDLIPAEDRRQYWSALAADSGLPLPFLMAEMRVYKRTAQVTGILVATCVCGAAVAATLGRSAWAGLGVGAAIGCALLGLAALAAIHKWWPHVEFPGRLKTVGELAGMAAGFYAERSRPDAPWTQEAVATPCTPSPRRRWA